MNAKPYRAQGYERALVVSIEDVLAQVRDPAVEKAEFGGYRVGVSSLRLQNFAKSTTCSCCGMQATHFAVESNSGRNPSWHLNLWAKVGEDQPEVLFTHDHTKARVLGGTNDASNTTTMCAPCNNKKGHAESQLAKALGIKRKNKPKTKKKKTDVAPVV